MLDLTTGILDFGNGETLAIDGPLAAFEPTLACARLSRQANPHVAELVNFHGWKESRGAWQLHVALTFYQGRSAGMSVHLANGPLSPFDWNRVSEALLEQEIQVLGRIAQTAVGRPADRATFAHAPAFGSLWDLPWGQLSAHGEPRSYTAGIYLTPRHRVGKSYTG